MADHDPLPRGPRPPTRPSRSPPPRSPQFLARLARLRPPALGGDPAEHAALLAHKAELFARIADQHARTDPAHAGQARRSPNAPARRHDTPKRRDAQDTTDVNDLTIPLVPRVGNFAEQHWGISASVISITALTIPWPTIAIVVAGAVAVGLLAALAPALRAGRLNPRMAIRTE